MGHVITVDLLTIGCPPLDRPLMALLVRVIGPNIWKYRLTKIGLLPLNEVITVCPSSPMDRAFIKNKYEVPSYIGMRFHV